MTDVEQGLAPPLTVLRSAGYGELMRMAWAGLAGLAVSPWERSALDRLGLAAHLTLRDRLLRTVLLGALRRN
jgi:hypothetical protein